MKLILEDKEHGRRFEADNLTSIDSIYEAIKDGLVAMSYTKNTAKELIEELKGVEE